MQAYERLLEYVKIYTTSDPQSGAHPSSERQLDLAHMLVKEMKELGLKDAHVDQYGYVYGTLPATAGCEKAPALGLVAHMDTAPGFSGENVCPLLHENYDGTDVTLPHGGTVLKVDEFPFLAEHKGETLITADGSTLLGADDKAGIAEILTVCERIQQDHLPHGKLCVAFTPDEEIGEGASLFDVEHFGADFAYTMDGGAVGGVEYENFNAASAEIEIQGVSVHPGSAKDVMVNALLVACELNSMLPADETPAHTDGYQGFFHLDGLTGTDAHARMGYIVRDHDREKFEARKRLLVEITDKLSEKYPKAVIRLKLHDSYYNMAEKIAPCMHLIENAKKATRDAGVEPCVEPIRGGTDGATLSYMGLPCPNLGTGGYNFHGPYECITVQSMEKAVGVLLNLVNIYSKPLGEE
ncbi:peptidase T [Ruthenibacterium sp. CLA-JM-H11]|uniref:Peptidase T n=1 Tax=Ruthenibacterium intestinale TaxID=3133163 RepID=A0ABV1GDC8_9FIRM